MSDLKDIRYLRLLWCNGAGMRCVRVIPLAKDTDRRRVQLEKLAHQGGPGLTQACMSLPSWMDVPAANSGQSTVGDVHLIADLNTVKLIPWHPNHAIVQVFMYDPFIDSTWPLCPRSLLQRILKVAEADRGLTIRAGFEIEFVLAHPDGEPLSSRTYCSASKFDEAALILDEMCEALEALGLSIEQLHAEAGPGQFEIALGHASALEAADGLLLAKEAIISIAAKHRLKASFLPKYRADQAGNGQHVHLSIWHAGRNLLALSDNHPPLNAIDFQSLKLNPIVSTFLAGVYHHLPSLMCFTTPSPNSFRRLQPNCWAGVYWCYGYGNKEAPIRIPVQPAAKGLFSNFEIKLLDSTANPHIALAAIIAAGLVGLDRSMALPSPIQVDPCTLSSKEQEAQGILSLPSDFASANTYLMKDHALIAYLGEPLVKCQIAVRESEWAHLASKSLEEEVRLLFDRY